MKYSFTMIALIYGNEWHMLEKLRAEVLEANLMLPRLGLAKFTLGNASGIDREKGLVVIKPSGVPYEKMTSADLVIVDMEGKVVEGRYHPSTDTPTHLELYRAFPSVGGIVHTHSPWASSFAMAGCPVPILGTTQADYFYGNVPCTRRMTAAEIQGAYEKETGRVIAETFTRLDPVQIPGVLVYGHGPYTWGHDAKEAAFNAAVLEESAFMDYHTLQLHPDAPLISQELLDRHYLRKHGIHAYYGQKRS